MKKIIIAGAGQMGLAAARIMDPNSAELLGFADNDSNKWTVPDGSCPENPDRVPVFSIQTAGYNNNLLPEYAYRTGIQYGWTGKEIVFASMLNEQWDEIESRS